MGCGDGCVWEVSGSCRWRCITRYVGWEGCRVEGCAGAGQPGAGFRYPPVYPSVFFPRSRVKGGGSIAGSRLGRGRDVALDAAVNPRTPRHTYRLNTREGGIENRAATTARYSIAGAPSNAVGPGRTIFPPISRWKSYSAVFRRLASEAMWRYVGMSSGRAAWPARGAARCASRWAACRRAIERAVRLCRERSIRLRGAKWKGDLLSGFRRHPPDFPDCRSLLSPRVWG